MHVGVQLGALVEEYTRRQARDPAGQGHQVEAVPTVIHERHAVITTLEVFIERLGARMARMLILGLPADREPTQADLHAIPAGRTFIHFKIVKRF
jgi:hypothetical protein